MQINSLSSYATNAYDTVRSNLRSMAEAGAEQRTAEAAPAPAPAATPEPAAQAPAPIKGQRQGVSLDSYA